MKTLIALVLICVGVWLFHDGWTMRASLKGKTQSALAGLARRVDGISQKMLTQTLRGLERDGLAKRTVYAEVPPRVVYELSPTGRSLIEPLTALTAWATTHMTDVKTAQSAYDKVNVTSV